jgi:flagellar M-ring protein FliF
MALLYGDLELRDAGQVTAALDKLRVPYEIQGGGSQILVPTDQVDRLRLAMAHEGLPASGSIGYELFDRGDSLTSSQFQQQIDQLRALEGELGRTIRSIHGVRNARVHLVLPKREPFAREQQEAKASVVLAMAGAQRMDKDEVQAILNLVASAVPGLKAENISIVDDRGQLLARSGSLSGPDASIRGHEEVRLATEQRFDQAVEDMLSRTLGAGHVRAEATVEMDFALTNETHEQFDPDNQVPRSQQTVTDANKSTEAPQSVSVQNNLPNPEPQNNGGAGSSQNHQEENTSFEIGKTMRTMVRDTPTIKRVSMAVLVDGTSQRGADGTMAWTELSQPDLDRIATLVKSAVGFDEKRGDKVDIVNMRFAGGEDLPDPTPAGFLGVHFSKADLMWLITLGVIALVALFALLFVMRPLALRLATALPTPAALDAPAPDNALALSAPAATGSAAPTDAEEDETLLNIANIQGQMRASSMRRLTQLVDQHPAASLAVVRGWLGQKVG